MKAEMLLRCVSCCAAVVILASGCATNLRKPSQEEPMASEEKFSTFTAYEMKPVTIADEFSKASANIKAAKKIDSLLFSKMPAILTGLKTYDPAPETPAERTLVIEPKIEEIKFIGGAARFWVGAMAGSSAVLMKVVFYDKVTGKVVAQPEFYQSGNAFGGAYSMGATDNMMLDQIVMDICNYTMLNR